MAEGCGKDGVDVRGYMAWSCSSEFPPFSPCDPTRGNSPNASNLEWVEGYRTHFGVTYVDYQTGQKRYPKKSASEIGKIFEPLIRKS